MKITLEKFINENSNGLFLLDSPTGFGKTTAVLEIIKEYLKDNSTLKDVNQIFFVTNLITNLPFKKLLSELTNEEQSQCLFLKNYAEGLLDNWKDCKIENQEVIFSQEFINLSGDIDTLFSLRNDYANKKKNNENCYSIGKAKKSLQEKIQTDLEPKFREFLRKKFFYNKSLVEKKKFIKENGWFKKLYPICELEKFKVIFTTTKKFFMKINLFYRMPFYVFEDEFLKGSIVFIDEFDATKKTLLDQIIEDGTKSKIDMVKLFLNIHYALQHAIMPNNLLKVSEYNKNKQRDDGWKTGTEHIDENKKLFNDKYDKFHFDFLLKSINFDYKKTFLFDDGKYITIFKDNSKKYLTTYLNKAEGNNSIEAKDRYLDYETTLNYLLQEIYYSVDHFIRAVFYLSQNYYFYKNEGHPNDVRFSQEEAIFTILDVFNLQEEFKNYIYDYISKGKLKSGWKSVDKNEEIRKGFQFTEVEDSNYHDLQTQINTFNFDTTPENILIEIANNSRLIGISATATLKTVIGNYDIAYIESILKEKYKKITEKDFLRISDAFDHMQDVFKGKVSFNVDIIDDFNMFSYKDKCEQLIDKLFENGLKGKYLSKIETVKSHFYYFSLLKLGYLYKELATKNIYSMVIFLNSLPKPNGDIDILELKILFEDISVECKTENIFYRIVQSKTFDEYMLEIKDELSKGKKAIVITTYQTIGTGKNIQYDIPNEDSVISKMIMGENTDRKDKDFDAIYLATPTHLTQNLSYKSENKYDDLARFLFQQEYLRQNKLVDYSQMRLNIINAFKKVFYSEKYFVSNDKNNDLFLHTAQYIIQAVGRICRCRNKNKEIHIYSDIEIIDRLEKVKDVLQGRLLNDEFRSLLNVKVSERKVSGLELYSNKNKQTWKTITLNSWTVRNSPENVERWKDLRNFVLQYPTLDIFKFIDYKDFYFEFDAKQSGYAYIKDRNYNFTDIKFEYRSNMRQVSEVDCDLQLITSVPCVYDTFNKNNYAIHFASSKFIMSESLYTQVYKGALGEVAGKAILESETGWDLEEIGDYNLYELFDYKKGNTYIDFKHWNEFYVDRNAHVEKIKRKLNRVNGAKAIIINLVQRADHIVRESVDEMIIEIPYLIDRDTGDICSTMIEKIEKYLN